jgi:hypothetical protein
LGGRELFVSDREYLTDVRFTVVVLGTERSVGLPPVFFEVMDFDFLAIYDGV